MVIQNIKKKKIKMHYHAKIYESEIHFFSYKARYFTLQIETNKKSYLLNFA